MIFVLGFRPKKPAKKKQKFSCALLEFQLANINSRTDVYKFDTILALPGSAYYNPQQG